MNWHRSYESIEPPEYEDKLRIEEELDRKYDNYDYEFHKWQDRQLEERKESEEK